MRGGAAVFSAIAGMPTDRMRSLSICFVITNKKLKHLLFVQPRRFALPTWQINVTDADVKAATASHQFR
jgi:hypothetical protein